MIKLEDTYNAQCKIWVLKQKQLRSTVHKYFSNFNGPASSVHPSLFQLEGYEGLYIPLRSEFRLWSIEICVLISLSRPYRCAVGFSNGSFIIQPLRRLVCSPPLVSCPAPLQGPMGSPHGDQS